MAKKRALVLCGGGSLGAYEFGCWQYFREKGITFDAVFGTSIGALNGAMIVSDAYEEASHLWNTITVGQVIDKGMNINADTLKDYGAEGLFRFARSYFQNSGADINPLMEVVKNAVNTNKVKTSPIPLGIVTTSYPGMKEKDILVQKDLSEDEILPYLHASSACWPIFPIMKIGKNHFVDGGFTNNLPIDFALREGAEEIVAIRLKSFPPTPQHVELCSLPGVTTIYSRHELGSIMDFTLEVLQRNIRFGYLDAKKTFHDAIGFDYTFSSWGPYEKMADDFFLDAIRDNPLSFDALKKEFTDANTTPSSSKDYFLLTAERIGEWLSMPLDREYELVDFFSEALKISHEVKLSPADSVKFQKGINRPLRRLEKASYLSYLSHQIRHHHQIKGLKTTLKRNPEILLIYSLMKNLLTTK